MRDNPVVNKLQRLLAAFFFFKNQALGRHGHPLQILPAHAARALVWEAAPPDDSRRQNPQKFSYLLGNFFARPLKENERKFLRMMR